MPEMFDETEIMESLGATSPSSGRAVGSPMNTQILPYELELFLSTDGKHTVHLKIPAGQDVLSPLNKASTLYDKIVEKYGLQPARSFQKPTQQAQQPTGLMCSRHNVPMRMNKNNKPYHRDEQRGFCNGRGFQDEQFQQEEYPQGGYQ